MDCPYKDLCNSYIIKEQHKLNVQRKQLTAIEEAQSYKALLDKRYMSQEELAKRMGLSQGAISNKLRLLTLSDEVQDAVLENKISERHARSLLKIKDQGVQNQWLNRIINERLTVKQLDDLLRGESFEDSPSSTESSIPASEPIEEPKIEEPRDFADVAVSMSTEEPDNSNFNLDSLDAFKLPEAPTKQEEKDPFNEMLNQVQDDGIESLDFLPPGVQSEVKSDISYLTEKVDRLITDMQNDTQVVTNKEDASNYTKYTIVINKSA